MKRLGGIFRGGPYVGKMHQFLLNIVPLRTTHPCHCMVMRHAHLSFPSCAVGAGSVTLPLSPTDKAASASDQVGGGPQAGNCLCLNRPSSPHELCVIYHAHCWSSHTPNVTCGSGLLAASHLPVTCGAFVSVSQIQLG